MSISSAGLRGCVLRWLGRLLLLGVGSVLGLLLAEGLLRWRTPGDAQWQLVSSPAQRQDARIFQVDPRWGLMLNPGSTGFFQTPEFQTTVRVNTLGLRGPEPSAQEGGLRVLVVGDSFTLAVQVAEEQTFSARLAGLLTARLQRPVEVLNGGVDSHGTRDAALQVERIGALLPLDAVVLNFFVGNDLYDNCFYRHRRLPTGPTPPPPPVHPLRRLSYLYTWILVMREQRSLVHNPRLLERYREELAPFSSADALARTLPCTAKALRTFGAVLAAEDLPGVVGLAPPAFAVHRERLEATFGLVGWAAAQVDLDAPAAAVADLLPPGIPAVDLAASLRDAAAGGGAMYFPLDGHWTAAAHAVVAEAYVEAVLEVLDGRR